MIDDLNKTLEILLRKFLSPALAQKVGITFLPPDDRFPPASVSLPAIDLFLHDVRENRDLRSNEWSVQQQGNGGVTKSPPPARVDCTYLITAWGPKRAANAIQTEFQILGEVLSILLRHQTFPPEVLQGKLQGQTPPVRGVPSQPDQLQTMGPFWQALGIKPRATLTYTVTISMAFDEPVQTQIVKEKVIDIRHKP